MMSKEKDFSLLSAIIKQLQDKTEEIREYEAFSTTQYTELQKFMNVHGNYTENDKKTLVDIVKYLIKVGCARYDWFFANYQNKSNLQTELLRCRVICTLKQDEFNYVVLNNTKELCDHLQMMKTDTQIKEHWKIYCDKNTAKYITNCTNNLDQDIKNMFYEKANATKARR